MLNNQMVKPATLSMFGGQNDLKKTQWFGGEMSQFWR